MQRRRSAPHTFEENIAAEKVKLEAQAAKLKPGPQMDAVLKKISQLVRDRRPYQRVAFLARIASSHMNRPGIEKPDLVN